jgi:glycosyltransferase involved in cell wall biosynthesis
MLSRLYPSEQRPTQGLFVQERVSELIRQGIDVTLVVPVPLSCRLLALLQEKWRVYYETPYVEEIEGVRVYHPRFAIWRGFYAISGFFYFLGLRRLVRVLHQKKRFELIHAQCVGPVPDGFGAALLNRAYGTPLVLTIHGQNQLYRSRWHPVYRVLNRYALSRASLVVTVSRKIRRLVHSCGADASKTVVVGNGISQNTAVKRQMLRPVGWDSRKVILSVAHLIRSKGIDLVLKILPEVLQTRQDILYCVIGSGPEEENLKRFANKSGLNEYVSFLGRFPHSQTVDYMGGCDIFVLPSWNESFGSVYVEAMAQGKPVIGCKGQGIEDVIEQGVTGLLVEPRDLTSLRDAILLLLGDEDLCKRIGENARQVVMRNHTWEKAMAKLRVYYSELYRSGTPSCEIRDFQSAGCA